MPKSDNNPIIFAWEFSQKNRIFAQKFLSIATLDFLSQIPTSQHQLCKGRAS